VLARALEREPEKRYASAAEFLDLVQELRETESSKYTLRDTPMYTCRRSTIEEILDSLA